MDLQTATREELIKLIAEQEKVIAELLAAVAALERTRTLASHQADEPPPSTPKNRGRRKRGQS